MRSAIASLIALLLTGCAWLDSRFGDDNFWRGYAATELKVSIDFDIQAEVRKDPPAGHLQEPYSPELWNAYWNDRIYYLYDVGKTPGTQAYRGPSGADLVRYVLETRRAKGLPELQIEDRNRDKVPKA